jgi:uncharacterized protein (UPF0332 family)
MLPKRIFFERTGNAAKTHRGVKSQFNRLAQHEPRIGRDLLTFMDEVYQFKAIADFGIGPAIDAITADVATSAIDTAERFIDIITRYCPLDIVSRSVQVSARKASVERTPDVIEYHI